MLNVEIWAVKVVRAHHDSPAVAEMRLIAAEDQTTALQNFFLLPLCSHHYSPRLLLTSPRTPPYLFFLIQSLFSLLSIHRTFFPPYRRDIGALRLRCGSSLVIGVNGLGRMKHCVPLSEIRHLFCVCGISEEIRGCWRWWTNVSSLKKKKPIRNCQRGGNTSHHITSQRRRCFNFTFSNATYLHPSCLKRPLLNFTALLCQFANWSKTTADVNLILGGSDDGVSGMEFIFLNGVCSLGGLNKEYSSQNSAYERNNTRWWWNWCTWWLQSSWV